MNILKRTLAGLLVVYLAFGQVTVIPGDWVQGFSSLTTADSNVYVTGAGTIGQDTSFTRSAAGRYTLYDATATTGVTTLTVRAGAGNLLGTDYLVLQDSAGAKLFGFNPAGSQKTYDPATGKSKSYMTAYSGEPGFGISSDSQYYFWSDDALMGARVAGLKLASSGNVSFTNGSSTTYATIGAAGIILNNGRFQIPTSTPASASATCTAGTIAWDTNFTYVCVAKDTWKRAAIATW